MMKIVLAVEIFSYCCERVMMSLCTSLQWYLQT